MTDEKKNMDELLKNVQVPERANETVRFNDLSEPKAEPKKERVPKSMMNAKYTEVENMEPMEPMRQMRPMETFDGDFEVLTKEQRDEIKLLQTKIRRLKLLFKDNSEVSSYRTGDLDSLSLEKLTEKYEDLQALCSGGGESGYARLLYEGGSRIMENVCIRQFNMEMEGMTRNALYEPNSPYPPQIKNCLKLIDVEYFSNFVKPNPMMMLSYLTLQNGFYTYSSNQLAGVVKQQSQSLPPQLLEKPITQPVQMPQQMTGPAVQSFNSPNIEDELIKNYINKMTSKENNNNDVVV